MCLYDSEKNELTISGIGLRGEGLAMQLAMSEQGRIGIDSNGLSHCIRGQLVYEPDMRAVPFPFPQRLSKVGLYSLVAAPLLVESKLFGILITARKEPEAFSSGECEFLRQLSEHVALAA